MYCITGSECAVIMCKSIYIHTQKVIIEPPLLGGPNARELKMASRMTGSDCAIGWQCVCILYLVRLRRLRRGKQVL